MRKKDALASDIENVAAAIREVQEAGGVAMWRDFQSQLRAIDDEMAGIRRGASELAVITALAQGQIGEAEADFARPAARMLDTMQRIRALVEETRTPAERLQSVYADLDLAFQRGRISAEQYMRVAERAERTAMGQGLENRLPSAIQSGSAEALTLIANASLESPENSASERAADHLAEIQQLTAQMVAELAEMARVQAEMRDEGRDVRNRQRPLTLQEQELLGD